MNAGFVGEEFPLLSWSLTMLGDKCHISGCERLAIEKCSLCSEMFCSEHFDDGHPYQLISSDYFC
ncbi:hypothetical protein JZU71_00495, partial [bacterium]|nr:hypothetical protein [bacterium]